MWGTLVSASQYATVAILVDVYPEVGDRRIIFPHFLESADDRCQPDGMFFLSFLEWKIVRLFFFVCHLSGRSTWVCSEHFVSGGAYQMWI